MIIEIGMLHGIKGRNIRLTHNELNNSKAIIVWNKKYSKEITIKDGLPQGYNEAGPIYNVYTG